MTKKVGSINIEFPAPDIVFEARRRGLGDLARRVWVDRHCAGLPQTRRAEIKLVVHSVHRLAMKHVLRARDALLAGDDQRYELELERARHDIRFAVSKMLEPFAISVSKQTAGLPKARAEAAKLRVRNQRLDDLLRAALAKGENPPVSKWARRLKCARSTVYAHMRAIKAETPR